MIKKLFKLSALFLIISILQPLKTNAENTMAAFLKVGAGAKASAMGEVSVLSDAVAIYWNPSGLAAIEKTAVNITYTSLYEEVNHNFVAVSRKALSGTMGLAVTYTDYGDLEGRDPNALITGNFSAGDMAVSLAYAKKIGNLSFGAALKYIHIKIGDEKGDGFASDAGLNWQTPIKNFSMNLSVLNMGPKFNFSSDKKSLPLAYNLGLKYTGVKKLDLYADMRIRPRDKDDEFCLGAEYRAMENFFIRTGYNSKSAKALKTEDDDGLKALDNLRGLSMGFGIQMKIFDLDYAFTPFGELGNAQRITVKKKF
ncbi:MAG: PorV/PorQ family protein [Elusimicrobiota bacterium]|nr:PorV/PorQ family protein [Elusimicrobiota bacterium]